MLRNATPLRKSAPWPPNISDEHVSCTAPATWNASLIIFANPLANAFDPMFCWFLARCRIPCSGHAKRHLKVQKCSVYPSVSCTFELRATTARTFSTSQLPKVLPTWGVLYMLTWKCASRHNGVQFFISHLASWLRTRRFSEPTCRPSGATNQWKTHSELPLFYLFVRLQLLSSDPFSSLIFFLFSDSPHLCFWWFSCHMVW